MKLDDFLKCKKVRCVNIGNHKFITVGKEYDVVGVDRDSVFIVNDNDSEDVYLYKHFEPVIDQAENPPQGMELTPEFEAVEPIFKVSNKVYVGLTGKIAQVTEIIDDEVVNVANKNNEVRAWISNICHATQENYERLQATFPAIEFEQPAKEFKGSDLCFEKLRNGKKLVMCAVSDLSDENAIKRLEDDDGCIRIIKDCDPAPYRFIDTHGVRHGFAVPLNDETGEPLTEAVLDE